jgi:hypothetical protein
MINKAQATLEFTVVFAILVALLMGMLSLWKWSSDRIVRRQVKYNSERISVGKRDSTPEGIPVLIECQGGACSPVATPGK